MDKNQKKIKYQELFLSELRNSYFGEKKIEEALQEMETKPNMEKLSGALKKIWKQTNDHVKILESAFPISDIKEQKTALVCEKTPHFDIERYENNPGEGHTTMKQLSISEIKNLKVVSQDHLIELIDDLDLNEVKEILASTGEDEKNASSYLARLAEKLQKNRDNKKIPDPKA